MCENKYVKEEANIFVMDFGFGKAIEVEVNEANDELFRKLSFEKEQKILGGVSYVLSVSKVEKIIKKAGSFEKVLAEIKEQLSQAGYKVKIKEQII